MKKTEKPFKFSQIKGASEFNDLLKREGFDFPFSEDTDILGEPINIYNSVIPNSLGIHPLEGFDGLPDGSPSDLTFRRYGRYGASGAGLIWYEAVAVMDEGKINPREMTIKKENIENFKKLVDYANACARQSRGQDFKPYHVVQLTHAGRRVRDNNWNNTPIAAVFNPFLDGEDRDGNVTYVTDEYIERVEDEFVNAAEYCAMAGFDAIDIKICHHYLLRELLSAVTREGKYGGSFENRIRVLFNIIEKTRKRVGDAIDISVRMNAYDANRYPYGWGMSKDGDMKPDLTEPIKLLKMLVEQNVKLINVSTMLPRYKPYGKGEAAGSDSETKINPFEGIQSLLDATRQLKQSVPEAVFVATGLSWFQQFGVNIAAGGKKEGWFDIGGFGRQAFAYPQFASDILDKGKMEHKKCCINCDKCYDLIINKAEGGCVVRDSEIYLPIYQKLFLKDK